MSRKRFGENLDERIAELTERAARRLSRRDALRRAVVGGTAGLAAIALGQRPADARTVCICGPTRRCSDCPDVGCPPHHHLCKGSFTSNCFNTQGYRCEWPDGAWIACTGLGHGLGYKICYDCIGRSGCPGWCTCRSTCICCDCQSAADVRAEQRRLRAAEA